MIEVRTSFYVTGFNFPFRSREVAQNAENVMNAIKDYPHSVEGFGEILHYKMNNGWTLLINTKTLNISISKPFSENKTIGTANIELLASRGYNWCLKKMVEEIKPKELVSSHSELAKHFIYLKKLTNETGDK